MRRTYCVIVIQCLFITVCLTELTIQKQDKFLNGFVNYLNNLPNQPYTVNEGTLLHIEETDEDTYKIDVQLRTVNVHNLNLVKYIKCTTTILDLKENGIIVQNNNYQCQDIDTNVENVGNIEFVVPDPTSTTIETPVQRKPVVLENEVRTETDVSSGEHFVAIPRQQPSAPCIGCVSHVNTQAPGVNELATLGVLHLDKHEPNVRHTLTNVLEVERQVQIVNGVRYVLTVTVEYNNCTSVELDSCNVTKPCKISILEKPWVRFSDGSKYRAIVANNCTEQWQFGDDGEVIHYNRGNNNINSSHNEGNVSLDDKIKAIHNLEVHASQNNVRVLTEEEIKNLEEQIVPYDYSFKPTEKNDEALRALSFDQIGLNSQHVTKDEVAKNTENFGSIEKSYTINRKNTLTDENKKAIDDLMNFFNFGGFNSKTNIAEDVTRIKRNYDYDLHVLSVADKFHKLKKNIDNAKYVYLIAQVMIDNLNEMDMEVKTRILKDVITAEEEFENNQHFFYIQAYVNIPCEKAKCDSESNENKICNGVIDVSSKENPQILSAFCYDDPKYNIIVGKVENVPKDDPVLHELLKHAIKKIESESSYKNAMKIERILGATTQKVSGTLTMISLELVYTNCDKTLSVARRNNCTVLEYLGSNICEIQIHERRWIKERKITYSCTQRPVDESFSNARKISKKLKRPINDPKIQEMVQEALQYLEVQSNKNNKQKVVEVTSVLTQLVAGLLTSIEFTVGYTTCATYLETDVNKCQLLESEPLRTCQAQVWDRPWLEDGRQLNVTCDIFTKNIESNEIPKYRKKRSTNSVFVGSQEEKNPNDPQYRILAEESLQMPGGQNEQNPNDPKYKTLAEESLQKFRQVSGGEQQYEVVEIVKVTTQVVAGIMTRIDFTVSSTKDQNSHVKNCHSEVWEKPWQNFKEITVNCDIDDNKSRGKRQLKGGQTEQNTNDPKFKTLAEESLQKYRQIYGDNQQYEVVEIVKVTTQVVAGIITRIDFTMSSALDQNSHVKNCHSNVWEKSWENFKEITVNCDVNDNKSRGKRQIPGGQTEQNPNDPKYKTLAEESLQKYRQIHGDDQQYEVVEIVKVTTQVVAGIMTRIDFTVSSSKDQNSHVKNCHSEVWEKAWQNFKEITVNCDVNDNKSRGKRQVLGGQTEQNPNDPKYKTLAEESLQKYRQIHGDDQQYEVVEIVKVTTQVVAGIITRIDFTVSSTKDQNSHVKNCHSKVWEKSWENFKEITVNCDVNDNKSRGKRQIPGGQTEQNPNDPKYKTLAEESLQKYRQIHGDEKQYEVVEIVKVTTQVVAGIMTRIDFTVSSANDQNSHVKNCHSKVWEKSWENFKEITVNCDVNDNKSRGKRQIPGGQTEQNPNDPKYKTLAEESLQKYRQIHFDEKQYEVVEIVKVTTQVVAGIMTRIDFTVSSANDQNSHVKNCHSKVWEKPWQNFKEITVNCDVNDNKSRGKRQVLGGQTEQNPKDPKYKTLAEESLQKHRQIHGDNQKYEVVDIVKVTTQVVAGIMTRIDFTVSSTLDQNSQVKNCHSEVWEKSWQNFKEITVNCDVNDNKSRGKRQVLGGQTEQNPNDPKYKTLAEESLQKYRHIHGDDQQYEVVEIVKVTTQVVAGIITRIDFTVSSTLDQNSQVKNCHSEVWEKSWQNFKEITVNCDVNDNKSRGKRQVLGGQTEQNPNDPKYKTLAEESLQKYRQIHGDDQHYEVVEIVKVTTQVVAGIITRIDFTVSSTKDQNSHVKNCHSKVWEKSWENFKEITVNCDVNDNKSRGKRQIPGGQTEQNPNDPKYKILAEESLQKYRHIHGDDQQYEVVEIVKVTTQVVAGIITRIDFTVSSTLDQISQVKNCHSKVWEKPWENFKEITVNCDGVGIENRDEKQEGNLQELIRTKRSLVGAPQEQDVNKQEYKLLAETSLRKYRHLKKIKFPLAVFKINRVVKQVVSGIIYDIDYTALSKQGHKDVLYNCHSKIRSHPGSSLKEIETSCKRSTNSNSATNISLDSDGDRTVRMKRENQLLTSKDVNNIEDKYQLLAKEALKKYEETSENKYSHKFVKIHSAKEEVLENSFTTLITIDYSILPSKCLTDNAKMNNNCKLPNFTLRCVTTIFDRLDEVNRTDIHNKCEKQKDEKQFDDELLKKIEMDIGERRKRQLRPDEDDIDEDIRYYYADRAVQYINDHSTSQNLQKLISIHAVQSSMQMNTYMVRMYIETATTFCLRREREAELHLCDEVEGLNHRLCLVRMWPSVDDELIINEVSVVCDDDRNFESVTGLSILELVKISIKEVEKSPQIKYKLVHQGEPNIIPSLDSNSPIKVNFIVATTNCTKNVDLDKNPFGCYVNPKQPSKACYSLVWMMPNSRKIKKVHAKCRLPQVERKKRSISLDLANATADDLIIQNLVQLSLEKLEMSSLHRYKQRILQINSYSSKITTGKVTTIDFDVGYTNCLKYEWVDNITSCEFLEHLPRRHCVSNIYERLWVDNGKNIDVNCEDDETPLEPHIEFETADTAMQFANIALKHIEAKYPHPRKQKIVRIFSIEKQIIAGTHYRMKVEVGFTNCTALSVQDNCNLVNNMGLNKFCRVNIWLRPWTDHPPNYRVNCDYQESNTGDIYLHIQAEHLFYDFLTTYKPEYANDHKEMLNRFEIFKDNIRRIHELNIHERGTAKYAITRFADLTYEEFSSKYMGLKPSLQDPNQVPMRAATIPQVDIPETFDWRELDAVTEVKDQGSCGSCWAFSVTGNIEGQWKLQSGKLVSLSEQELVDCDKLDEGCNGGLPDNAYRAIEQLGGLESEDDYPYEGEDDKCAFNKSLSRVKISGAVNISSNEMDMARWLVENGPISIGINANAMQFYVGGISHPWKMLCSPKNLDHGVLIVGYGIKNYPIFNKKMPYWIVKNSWGKSWGEQGYYRVFRGDGTCGVNQMASSAVI